MSEKNGSVCLFQVPAKASPHYDARVSASIFNLIKLVDVDQETGRLLHEHVLREIFIYPDVTSMYVDPLVDRFKGHEKHVDAVVGYGNIGAMYAGLVAQSFQNLYKDPHSVIALSIESIDTEKREGRFALGVSGKLLRNRRTLFVEPILTPEIWARVKACISFVSAPHNLGSVCCVGTILQYGNRPAGTLSGCEVESLMHIQCRT